MIIYSSAKLMGDCSDGLPDGSRKYKWDSCATSSDWSRFDSNPLTSSSSVAQWPANCAQKWPIWRYFYFPQSWKNIFLCLKTFPWPQNVFGFDSIPSWSMQLNPSKNQTHGERRVKMEILNRPTMFLSTKSLGSMITFGSSIADSLSQQRRFEEIRVLQRWLNSQSLQVAPTLSWLFLKASIP